MRPAVIAGAVRIPIEHIDLDKVREQTTYAYLPMGAEEELLVEAHWLDGDFLCVPRQYGIRLCNQLQIPLEDETSEGSEVEFPVAVKPRDYQKGPLRDIEKTFNSVFDFIFRAHTGWGKTIGALIVASRLRRTTLIVVDQENLKTQWLDALLNVFGFRRDQIGTIQGKVCDYEGRAVVVAMIQSLSQKRYKPEVYDYFGFLIVDEVHTAGAPTFSSVLTQFSATYRLGVSATPARLDGLQKALEHNLGRVRVSADKEHKRSAVYIIRSPKVYSWYGNISPKVGRIVTEVAEDGPRNLMAAEAIVWMYETGRDVLVLSDRIEHLKNMKSLLFYMGLEDEEVGLYTGYDPVYKFTKDAKPQRRPRDLHSWVGDGGDRQFAEYTPVSLQMQNKRIPKARLKEVKENARVILATYGMFSKGVDEPRLSGGIDLTPRTRAEQIHGRILREEPGKRTPIWVTIVDENNYRLMYSFSGRIGEYLKSNAVLFEWDEEGELTEWDVRELRAETNQRVKELKKCTIETSSAGINTLVTPELKKQQKREQDRATERRIRARRPRSR